MTSPTQPRRRLPSGAGLLLLFVVGGVFGMHALGAHGVAGNHMGGIAHHPSTLGSGMDGGSPVMGPADHQDSSTTVSVFAASSSVLAPADDFASGMSLCLGVLASSVLMLMLRRAQRLPVIDLAPRWLTPAHQSNTRDRDRDPPSLTLLSVRRC